MVVGTRLRLAQRRDEVVKRADRVLVQPDLAEGLQLWLQKLAVRVLLVDPARVSSA